MDTFKFFHFCDHKFPLSDDDAEVRDILIENGNTLIDVISPRARILDIKEVKAVTYDVIEPPINSIYDNPDREQTYDDEDAQDQHYDSDDDFFVDFSQFQREEGGVVEVLPVPTHMYSLYLHNRIQWFVRPPKTYTAKVSVLYAEDRERQYLAEECPRCGGFGWFVDLLNSKRTFERAVGIDKVLQRIIRDLKTEIGQSILDRTDGTILAQVLHESGGNKSDEKLFGEIRLVISEVEDKYLARQMPFLNTLPDDEILVRLDVTKLFRAPKNPIRIVMEMVIETRSETRMLRIPI